MNNEQFYLAKCKQLIEEKLGWGESQHWQNQNFDDLSSQILDETDVNLSNSTLKRIWGKVKYDSSPNLATLNTLAQFIGYVNWRQFTKTLEQEKHNLAPAQVNQSSREPFRYKNYLFGLVLIGLLTVFGLRWSFKNQPKKLKYKNIRFTSTPVTKGLPNTIVFHYNAAESNADSVYIQQSWDPTRRYRVDKNLHEYTSTYYTPGYFRAKLILNDSIVKQHDLFIESDGWMATIDNRPIPTYIKIKKSDSEIISIDINEVPDKIEFRDKKLWTTLHNVSDTMTVSSESFKMETELQSTYSEEDAVCQFTEILLLASDGVIIIPLSIKGCVGEIGLKIGEKNISGRTADLSAFGVEFKEFVNVKCAVKNKRIKIFVNENIAYDGEFDNSIGKIVGTRIRFRGTGQVRKFEIGDN